MATEVCDYSEACPYNCCSRAFKNDILCALLAVHYLVRALCFHANRVMLHHAIRHFSVTLGTCNFGGIRYPTIEFCLYVCASMRLWLLCCACLFIGFQIYDWISHQAWLTADLSLLWVILGGLGLAIASNRSLPSATPPSKIKTKASSLQMPQVSPKDSLKISTDVAIASNNSQSQAEKESISFEIPKKTRPRAS